MTAPADFTALPDLASRLGGSVVFATDELFAAKESLITAGAPVFTAGSFGHKGQIYDGWETRRRRGPGHDHAIVRLGAPGIVHGVVVDTAHFRGNFPPQVSVEATWAQGYPTPAELAERPWDMLVGRTGAQGDTANRYPVIDRRCWTHVRLSIYPDGGVARFRVHGQILPDPAFLTGTIDLAAMDNGGQLVDCSDAFYSSAANLIKPGRPLAPNDGWESARRRGAGNDYAVIRLAAAGQLRHVEIDTAHFVGNAPDSARLSAADRRGASQAAGLTWWEVLPQTRLQPDARHRFLVDSPRAATHVRLDVIPDGGVARLRIYGEVAAEALAEATRRWREALPSARR